MAISNTTNSFVVLFVQIYHDIWLGFLPLFVIGLILNIVLLNLLFTDNDFQNSTYRLIRMFVISDVISVTATATMFSISIFVNLDYIVSSNLCRVLATTTFSSTAISIMNLALVAVDRYFSIVRPFSPFYRNHKIKFLIITEFLVWLISISATSPFILYLAPIPGLPTSCDFPHMDLDQSIYLILWVIIAYAIPIVTIIFSYAKIISFQKNYVRPGIRTSEQLDNDFRNRRKFIKVLIYITLCYIIIILPHALNCTVSGIYQKSVVSMSVGNTSTFILAYLAIAIAASLPVINPTIYMTFDKRVRAGMLSKLARLFHCSK
ncbi:G-protein coupled receptor 183 [Trichoplax sp. H2]|nr:G-protein coupled receptor 183 [Trichoplax sp. H2]|eukprot:RDD39366.1 G-protein coupled receptor 183 [Trichoplax sp. H2]